LLIDNGILPGSETSWALRIFDASPMKSYNKSLPATRSLSQIIVAIFGVLLLVCLSGCVSPYGVKELGPEASYEQTNRSALSSDIPSDASLNVLRRHGLLSEWRDDPAAAIASLRGFVIADASLWPEYFALAELSYMQGRRNNSQADYLAAALYAYAFLAPGGTETMPDPYDRQVQQACDFYNLGLVWALTPPNQPVPIVSGTYNLPFGQIALTADPRDLEWRGGAFTEFQSTATFEPKGLTNIYSTSGIGDPLAAEVAQPAVPGQALDYAPELRVPANLLLVMDHPRQQIAQSRLTGQLVIHTIYDQRTVDVGNNAVSLNYDQSTALAFSLATTPSRYRGLLAFLNGQTRNQKPTLVALEPHQHGYMPIVFIHGTTSNATTWANMVNDLQEDPAVRDHFEFWFFSYASGNPIPYSAWQLRQAIAAAVKQLGGVQADPALGQITLIGHSQGGLLAKMLVINPGDRLWSGIGLPPPGTLNLSPKSKALIQAMLFNTAMPEVKRVIFLSTPQHGSFVAGFSVAGMVAKLVKLPADVTSVVAEGFGGNGRVAVIGDRRMVVGSISGMSPRSPFIQTLATIPIAPGVHAHSIISVSTKGPVALGNDGVVSYQSAHITGVDSELVVRSTHSSQSNPATVAEVERILQLQIISSGLPPGPPGANEE
jgi:pimeloyl-ACP methyl ester carboxylesterase